MFEINCRKHTRRSFGVCANPSCEHRFICREDDCLQGHCHNGYQVNLITIESICQKKEVVRPLLERARSTFQECLTRLGKVMQLALHCYSKETSAINDLDLAHISIGELHDFMRSNPKDESIIQEIDKLTSKLITEATAFHETCLKRYPKSSSQKHPHESIDSIVSNPQEPQSTIASKKKHKKQVIIAPPKPKEVPYIQSYFFGFNQEGMQKLSHSISLFEKPADKESISKRLFDFLQKNNLRADNRLFLWSNSDKPNDQFIKQAYNSESSLLLANCETLGQKAQTFITGYYRRSAWSPTCSICPHSFMFELYPDRPIIKHEIASAYKECCDFNKLQIASAPNIVIGYADFVIAADCRRYRSFIQSGKMYGLKKTMPIKVKDYELIKVSQINTEVSKPHNGTWLIDEGSETTVILTPQKRIAESVDTNFISQATQQTKDQSFN